MDLAPKVLKGKLGIALNLNKTQLHESRVNFVNMLIPYRIQTNLGLLNYSFVICYVELLHLYHPFLMPIQIHSVHLEVILQALQNVRAGHLDCKRLQGVRYFYHF